MLGLGIKVVATPPFAEKPGLSVWIASIALVVGAVILTAPSLVSLHHRWTTGFTYEYGYLVLGMAIWLARHLLLRTGEISLRPHWAGVVPLTVTAVVLVAAQLTGVDIGQQILLPALLWFALLTVAGLRLALRLSPAFAFIYFAIPVWEILTRPLQQLTTFIVELLLEFHEFPALIEGFRVTVPAGDFEIAAGCSGLSFLVAGLAISVFYALTEMRSLRGRALAVILATSMCLLTNWVRVYVLILVGQYTRMQHYLISTDHYFFGWALFGVAIAIYFLIVRKLEPVPADDRQPLVLLRSGAFMPAVVALTAVVLTLALSRAALSGPRVNGAVSLLVAPGAAWTITTAPNPSWRPVQSANAVTAEGFAEKAGDDVDWYVAWYPWQENNREVMAWGNGPWDKRWRQIEASVMRDYQVAEVLDDAGQRRLVAWRQTVGGHRVDNRFDAKLRQLQGMLKGNRSASFHAVSTACRGACDDERAAFEAAAADWLKSVRIEIEVEGDS